MSLKLSIQSAILLGTQFLLAHAQQQTNFLQPGTPTKEDEGKEFEEISPFRRFLHKFGVDTNPAGVVIGFLFLCGAGGGGYYIYKEKQKERVSGAKEDDA
ncbi:Oidioi.mRNA.OKI2018_I69.PAR.g9128.t1.cds [Oikopleura dioica]|uniref:Oidioi.mRNA.OKI2018_I69.PAR.g9128.t1.cds n=1 Tax=Oikopleura dioica TaxID=34765 RepID=A0ABN7RJ46_OIKDI|nr:Oidioi.mRNA.OKI2018_I69.PAR.g9128.t1.cds [Oikopleura dioica]